LDQGRGASRYGEDADLWAGLDQLEVGAGAGGFIGHVVAHRLCFGGFVDRVGFHDDGEVDGLDVSRELVMMNGRSWLGRR
jgi:hypothetical protein